MNFPLHRLIPRLGPLAAAASVVVVLAAGQPVPAAAQSYLKSQPIGGNPGPAHNYVCPNADGKPALDCFLDAVRHLYTMCRHVKGIEIIEFGYAKSQEGVNGAKSEYCVDKQKLNMTRVYQAALREATVSNQAVDMVRSLHDFWLDSLARLRWTEGESDEDYKMRTAQVYDILDERSSGIRTIVTTVRAHVVPAKASGKPLPREPAQARAAH